MEQKNEITVKLKLSAKHIFAAVVLSLIIWRPALLESAQSMTMTSYYPAPYGGYNQLLTTGNTYLADNNARVYVSRNGGRFCVGTSANGAGYCPASSGNGVKTNTYFYGATYLGMALDGTNVSTSTASGDTATYGRTYLAHNDGRVYVGSSIPTPSTGNVMGLFSRVPMGTNTWFYVGSGGNSKQYNTPLERNSSSGNNERMGILVDASVAASAGGIGVVRGAATAIMTTGTNQARIGGAQNTSLNIVAGNNSAMTMTVDAPPIITVNGLTKFQNDIYLGTIDSNGYQSGTLRKIKGLCYQKIYGRTRDSACDSGYAAVGFLPNDGLTGMVANGRNYVGSIGTAGTVWQGSGNVTIESKGYSNPHVLAGGWLTCCAMYIPVK